MSTLDLDKPFFLVSTTRSGTTLLSLILGHHRRIAGCEEFNFAVDCLTDDGPLPSGDEYRRWLENSRTFNRAALKVDSRAEYQDQLRQFLGQTPSPAGKSLIGAVVHRNFHHLPRIWPQAKYIHLIRDPRNVAMSWIGMGWAGTAFHGVQGWIDAERDWDRLRAGLNEKQYFQVRFEDLLENPQGTLSLLCEFLGVEFEPDMLRIDRDTTYSPPTSGRSRSNWRAKLGPRDVRRIETRVGDLLAERGYEPSGLPRLHISPGEQVWLSLSNRIGRFRFRIRRYGLWLALRITLSERLPLSGWRNRVEREFESINIEHLK